jgi:hypothetical protein
MDMNQWESALRRQLESLEDSIAHDELRMKDLELRIMKKHQFIRKVVFRIENRVWKQLIFWLQVECVVDLCLLYESRDTCSNCYQYMEFFLCVPCAQRATGRVALWVSHEIPPFTPRSLCGVAKKDADFRRSSEEEQSRWNRLLQYLPENFMIEVQDGRGPFTVWTQGDATIFVTPREPARLPLASAKPCPSIVSIFANRC